MVAPQLTNEQRMKALEKAMVARKKRAEFLASITSKNIPASKALDIAMNDDILKRISVRSFIQAYPGFGKQKTERLMEEVGIAKTRRVGGLGKRQCKELIEILG